VRKKEHLAFTKRSDKDKEFMDALEKNMKEELSVHEKNSDFWKKLLESWIVPSNQTT
jgi:hypothetical protein